MNSQPPPTLAQIAQRAGVSKVTVSRVLRGEPHHSPETRKKVEDIAGEMGWRPNPLVAAHMASLRRKTVAAKAALAFLTSSHSATAWRDNAAVVHFHVGAKERALEKGYPLDTLWILEKNMGASRLASVLRARGIYGALLAPSHHPDQHLHLDLTHLAVVAVGFKPAAEATHYVHHNCFHATQNAFKVMLSRGYRRPALAVNDASDAFAENLYSALFLRLQWDLPAARRIPPLIGNLHTWTYAVFRKWFLRHQPDALAFINPDVPAWLRHMEKDIPANLGLLHLNRPDGDSLWTGLNLPHHDVGRTAVDLLLERMHLCAYGVQTHARAILLDALWHEGETLPGARRKSLLPSAM